MVGGILHLIPFYTFRHMNHNILPIPKTNLNLYLKNKVDFQCDFALLRINNNS